MTPVVVLPEAEEEIRQAMLWYEGQRPGLGVEFLGCVEHALVRIAEEPHRFGRWPTDDRYRRAMVDRFPYVVVFESRDDHLEVVAVAHAKRRPAYWTGRSPRS